MKGEGRNKRTRKQERRREGAGDGRAGGGRRKGKGWRESRGPLKIHERGMPLSNFSESSSATSGFSLSRKGRLPCDLTSLTERMGVAPSYDPRPTIWSSN